MKKLAMLFLVVVSVFSYADTDTTKNHTYSYKMIVDNDIDILTSLKKSAEENDAEALSLLAMMNEYGIVTPQDKKEGYKYYDKVCKIDYPFDCFDEAIRADLINRLYDAYFNNQDEHAKQLINLFAEKNNPEALAMMGFINEHGVGITKNIPEAINLYKTACEISSMNGCLNAWYFYHFGVGVDKNDAEAQKILDMRKNTQEDAIYADNINFFYNAKFQIEQDPTLHAQLINKIKLFISNSSFKTKLIYALDGFGPQDLLRLNRLWAHKENTPELNYLVGHLYNFSFAGPLFKDKDLEAILWFTKAAESGHSEAQNILGYAYKTGALGQKFDSQLALKWLEKAASQNQNQALYHLGDIYYKGELVEVDYEKAFSYLSKADQAGNTRASELLSQMYYNGQYVDFDCQKALFYTNNKKLPNGKLDEEQDKIFIEQCQKDHLVRSRAGQNIPNVTLKHEKTYFNGKDNAAKCELYFSAKSDAIAEISNLRAEIELINVNNQNLVYQLAFPPFGLSLEEKKGDTFSYNSSKVGILLPIYDNRICNNVDEFKIRTSFANINSKKTDLLQNKMISQNLE